MGKGMRLVHLNPVNEWEVSFQLEGYRSSSTNVLRYFALRSVDDRQACSRSTGDNFVGVERIRVESTECEQWIATGQR